VWAGTICCIYLTSKLGRLLLTRQYCIYCIYLLCRVVDSMYGRRIMHRPTTKINPNHHSNYVLLLQCATRPGRPSHARDRKRPRRRSAGGPGGGPWPHSTPRPGGCCARQTDIAGERRPGIGTDGTDAVPQIAPVEDVGSRRRWRRSQCRRRRCTSRQCAPRGVGGEEYCHHYDNEEGNGKEEGDEEAYEEAYEDAAPSFASSNMSGPPLVREDVARRPSRGGGGGGTRASSSTSCAPGGGGGRGIAGERCQGLERDRRGAELLEWRTSAPGVVGVVHDAVDGVALLVNALHPG